LVLAEIPDIVPGYPDSGGCEQNQAQEQYNIKTVPVNGGKKPAPKKPLS
jgi:hypothetical protein